MTRTGTLLRRLATPHTRARALAVLLTSAGVAFGAAAVGVALSPRLAVVLVAWAAIGASAAGAVWLVARVRRAAAPAEMARLVENAVAARSGSVVALVTPLVGRGGASAELLTAADRRAERAVASAAPVVRRLLARGTRWRLAGGLAVAVVGAMLLLAAAPGRGETAAFWHPVRAWRDARAPVRLAVDRHRVRRGDTVRVRVDVPGGTRATLWTRGPGEAWRPQALALDSAGRTTLAIGPMTGDLFLRAASGRRRSDELRIAVERPAFLSDVALTARYPAYLERPDEALVPGRDTIPIPAGTTIRARGFASTPLQAAAWVRAAPPGGGGLRVTPLAVHGERFEGPLAPATSGVWRLALSPSGGETLEGPALELHLRVVPDSAPVVRLPVPQRDTTLPLSLRQPLVIDAQDDHGIARAAIVSRRVSRTGRRDDPVRQPLDVSGAGDHAVLQTTLDLRARSLLPGDTVRVHVEAWDNAPVPHVGRSEEIALRLLSMEELRAETRAAARAAAATGEALAQAQAEIGDRTRDLAQTRSRDAAADAAAGERARPSGALPFQSRERAEEVMRRQAEVSERVAELARAVEDIARAARAAGVGDSAFQARLDEVRELLERALTPELEQRLRELQEALGRLDPEATRQALEQLVEAQQRLRDELARSQELFRRAAAEGALATLAADAEALHERQQEWNRDGARRADSAAAAWQRELVPLTDSLARGIDQAARDLRAPPAGGDPLAAPQAGARRAGQAMARAAEGAERADAAQAQAAGAAAAEELAELPAALRARRDSLAGAWRRETLEALDRALAETAGLAERQEEVVASLRRAEGGAQTRGRQAAIEEGTQAIERQIREASSRHAMVPAGIERALGFGQHQMRAARQQLEQGDPNTTAAAVLAEQALGALNVTAYALARSRGEVAGARSGTGLQEAMEQLARLAGRQGGLNAEAQGLMSLGPGGAVGQQLRALAARQRALAEELERVQAGGGSAAAGPLAEEARELARQLEQGRLDRQTVERQERLYRRLLDAGRTLSGEEPDERKDRVSRAATPDSVRRPSPLAPGAAGPGVKIRYPSWEQLRGLTPEQRRLVLEYFRLLNAPD